MTDWKVSEIYEPQPKMSITEMAPEDRPRERLMAHGAEALSTAELIAILIGSGTTKESAVTLMQRVMKDCNNSLANLCRMSMQQLMQYPGIGQAKAITILAACELARRRETEEPQKRKVMDNAQKIYDHLWPKMRDLDVEESYLLLMNQRLALMDTIRLSHGGITETAMDVRIIMKHAILAGATVIAIAHNHPSGNLRPSRDDDNVTRKVKDACTTMRLHLLDHVIVTDGNYYSYAENGKL